MAKILINFDFLFCKIIRIRFLMHLSDMSKYCYDYQRPAVSADSVIFGFDGEDLNVMLIERGKEPYKGRWTFPGGFLDMDETTLKCAARELNEETGIEGVELEQLGAYSGVDRDPRGRVITVAYFGFVKMSEIDPVAGDDAVNAMWFNLKDIPALAFDHDLILRTAVNRLKTIIKPENNLSLKNGIFPSGPELGKLRSVLAKLNFAPYHPE